MENFHENDENKICPHDEQENMETDRADLTRKRTKKNDVADMQKSILSYLHDLVFLLAALLLLFVMIFRIVVVSGESMLPTLHEGDYLVILSSSIYRNPKQGDVVVISKDAYDSGKPLVKRVVAVGGQKVDIRDGVVYVDEKPVKGEYTHGSREIELPIIVPEGKLFVLGDNRDNSMDSRSNEIGMIDEREVLGKVLFIALPAKGAAGGRDFNRFGAV